MFEQVLANSETLPKLPKWSVRRRTQRCLIFWIFGSINATICCAKKSLKTGRLFLVSLPGLVCISPPTTPWFRGPWLDHANLDANATAADSSATPWTKTTGDVKPIPKRRHFCAKPCKPLTLSGSSDGLLTFFCTTILVVSRRQLPTPLLALKFPTKQYMFYVGPL